MIAFLLRLPKIRNSSDKSRRGNQNTQFAFNNFFSEIRAVYEKMWKNMIELARPQMTM